jgi:hypothetical protein
VLLGGPGESSEATVGLSAGEAVAAPSGRADDFSWPRGVVNVEPATVEPAAPDTAAPDAGAKSAKPAQGKSAMDAYAAQTRPGAKAPGPKKPTLKRALPGSHSRRTYPHVERAYVSGGANSNQNSPHRRHSS